MKKEKAVKGGVYLTIVNVVSQLLSTVLSVILARLLAPEDFGLMALVLTFLGFIELFTKIGFGSAIIQKKEPKSNSNFNALLDKPIFWCYYFGNYHCWNTMVC